MKWIYLSIIGLLVTTNAFANVDFIGVYRCKGHDPYLNKDYSGTVTIAQQNTVYKITMQYDTGEKYRATGGPYGDDLLSVVFQDTKNLKRVGLEQYRLEKGAKKMGGFWVYLGEDKLGTEICDKQ